MVKKSIDDSKSVAVIILNYKGLEDTKAAIDSMLKQTHKAIHIVVIDNGSNDGSADSLRMLSESNSTITFIQNTNNLGFAGGVNTGIEWALYQTYPYIALFNNDAIADPTWLQELIKTIDIHSSTGIATGLLLNATGLEIDSAGECYSQWGLAFSRNRGLSVKTTPTSDFVFGATGGASLYKAIVFEKIGLFDEDFFAYYEDTDISFRAQLQSYHVAYTNKAIAYHKKGATSNKIPGFTTLHTFKNMPFVLLKNIPRQLILPMFTRFIPVYGLFYVKALCTGKGIPATKGLLQALGLLPRMLRKRRHIQSTISVDNSYIKNIFYPDPPPDQTGMRKLRSFFTGKK